MVYPGAKAFFLVELSVRLRKNPGSPQRLRVFYEFGQEEKPKFFDVLGNIGRVAEWFIATVLKTVGRWELVRPGTRVQGEPRTDCR